MNHVFVLFNGYSYFENNSEVMKANSSCILIKSEKCNIIVDTMTAWDSELILRELKFHHIKPEDINFVISSHGHSDHIGNNNLFLNASYHIVGTSVSNRNVYFPHDFTKESYKISDDIEVIGTPGHTMSCVSVVIRNSNLLDDSMNPGCCVLSGDLFEKEEDIMDKKIWIGAGSEDPSSQLKNRLKIAKIADYIIPGHGPMFKVTKEIREKLEEDFQLNGV